jgi:DMATS type aromatic prenyltransferase
VVRATKERSEAVTERPKASGEYVAVRRSAPPRLSLRARTTYQARAESDLFRLCAAVGHEAQFEGYLDAQRALFAGWGDREISEHPMLDSGILDDGSPFAFALSFAADGVELRLLVEAQSEEPSAAAMRVTALDLNRSLGSRFGLDFTRFAAVRGLFLDGEPGPFSLWHAVSWRHGKKPSFRLYLNPRAHGVELAHALARESLVRLGVGLEATSCLERLVARPGDEIRYVSLDLSSAPEARVTVYVAHHGVSSGELEHIAAMSPLHVAGEVSAFSEAMLGHAGPFLKGPVTTSISFAAGSTAPLAVAVHVPISKYVPSDAVTVQRVAKFLNEQGLDDVSYRRAMHVFAPRPLEAGVGVQSYASCRRETGGIRFSAWLSPEIVARTAQSIST